MKVRDFLSMFNVMDDEIELIIMLPDEEYCFPIRIMLARWEKLNDTAKDYLDLTVNRVDIQGARGGGMIIHTYEAETEEK